MRLGIVKKPSAVQDSLRTWELRRPALRCAVTAVALAVLGPVFGQAQTAANTVSLTQVPAALKGYAVGAGRRLQAPGKERLSAAGTLVTITNGVSTTATVTVVWQIPLKLSITPSGASSMTFTPAAVSQSAQNSATAFETLVNDSVEGLIGWAQNGGAARVLATSSRPQGGASTDPAYDVVQLLFPDALNQGKTQARTYWFNSQTKLLSKITYQTPLGTAVEVKPGNWQTVQGENVPFLIERRENGVLALRLTLSTATVSAAAQDGIFGGN